MDARDNICNQIDALLEKIESSGAYITEDAKMAAKAIKRSVQSLSLNPVMHNDN